MVILIEFQMTERYDACWFEIKTSDKSMLMRDCEKFLRKSSTLARVEEVRLYRIEKSATGMKRIRIFSE